MVATPEQTPDADLEKVLQTLTPQKLIRRSMLVDHDIRFPEEKVRLEDGMMLTRAYYAAARVSALGDYDYYYIRTRDDGQNISQGRLDPPGYTWSIGEVSRLVKEHDPDPARADRIVLDLYRRKCLKMYGPVRFAKMQDIHRDQWLHEHAKYIATYIPPELEAELARRSGNVPNESGPATRRACCCWAGSRRARPSRRSCADGGRSCRSGWSSGSSCSRQRPARPTSSCSSRTAIRRSAPRSPSRMAIPGDAAGAGHMLAALSTIVTCSAKIPRS